MSISNGTYLTNLFDPEVVGDLIDKKLVDLMRFAPLATIDTTLAGRPGDVITLPYYSYIGNATTVAEGENIAISQLVESTTTAQIHKIAKGVQITDEAVLSGYGDPMGEAVDQIVLSIASALDNEMLATMANATLSNASASTGFVASDVSDALELFGEDIDGDKVLVIPPAWANTLRKSDWVPASEIAADIRIKGAVGMSYGCQVVISDKLKSLNQGYIVKPGALRIFLKRDTLVEYDRDIVNKSNVITADKHEVTYIYDDKKIIKLYLAS